MADTSALEKQARLIRCQILSETNFFYLSDIWNEDLSWLKDHTSGKELTEVLTLELHKISENNYLFEGQTEYVLSLLDKITELGHEDVDVQIKRIEAYFGAYNYGLALAATDRALSMTNDRDKILDVLSLRAWILDKMRKFDELYQLCEQVRKQYKAEKFGQFLKTTGNIEEEILYRCAIDYEFSDLDETRTRAIRRIAHFLSTWRGRVETKNPRVANTLSKLLDSTK